MRANCEQPGARQADVFLRVYFARKIHFTAFFSRRARAGVCRARPFGVLNMCRASRALAAFQRFCGWKGGAPHGIPCNKAWCGHCGPLAGAGRRAGGLSAQPRRVGARIAGRVGGGRIRRPCPPAGLCQAVIGRHHVSARWGLLFPSVRRFPRRFVTGCHILETPLCRLAGVCVLMFSNSGAFLILPGFEAKDAQQAARLLSLEEGRP